MSLRRFGIVLMSCVFFLIVCGCAAGSGDSGSDGDSLDVAEGSGDCAGGGWCGEQAISVTADTSNAKALFTMQDSEGANASLSAKANKALVGTQSQLYKLLEDDTYEQVIQATDGNGDAKGDLPEISYIAANDQNDFIIVFQHPYMYREPADSYSDPWSPSSPYTCQAFSVNAEVADGNVCCITSSLELDTWDYRTNKIQFDGDGNAYFNAHVPQNWKNVMVKWNRDSVPAVAEDGSCTYGDDALEEVINANIVPRDFVVVPTGGVFYTGFTSTDGSWDDSGSFLRFRADDGQLQEITSGWWDYIFQPIEVGDNLLGVDPVVALSESESLESERVLFYGPDPLQASTPEWDDSCLYLYDTNLSGEERVTEIADCEIDVWQYVNWADTIDDQRTRCAESKYMMGGGNQPKKILLADSFDDEGNYNQSEAFTRADEQKEIFVVGNVFAKKAGEWRYDIWVDESHCVMADVPTRDHEVEGDCTTAGGSWVDPTGYNQLTDADLLDAIDADDDPNWHLNGQWCETPGGDWRETYSALARVNYEDEDTRSIELLSTTNDIVKNGWVVNDRLYYLVFEVTSGEYRLMEHDNEEPLITGYEVYELFMDPSDREKLYFNGLKFATNEYVMATMNADGSNLDEEEGLTGQIETLIVIPDEELQ